MTTGDPIPTHQLEPGRYIRSWADYAMPVEVRLEDGELVHEVPSGLVEPVTTVPDALWAPVVTKDAVEDYLWPEFVQAWLLRNVVYQPETA